MGGFPKLLMFIVGNNKGGSTIDLLFDWFGLVCFPNKNNNCQLSYCRFTTSQTGGQQYRDTSPFNIPWFIGMGLEKLAASGTAHLM
jgi:hypothetical protein